MRIKKLSIFIAIMMLITLTVSQCSKSEEESTTENLKEVNVLLDWYPNAVHSFLYAAKEQGYFKEEGLKVNLITPAGTEDGIKLVATGKADLAISYPRQVIIAKGENIPVKLVGTIVRSSLNHLMVRKDSGVKTLKDLEGKKVGYPSFEIDKKTVESMVKEAGGDPSKVEFIDVGYDLMASIQAKRVDAIIGGFINHEKILLEKEGFELVTFNPVDSKIPNIYELGFIASLDGISNNKNVIEGFLRASKKGYDYTKNNPDEAIELVLKVQDGSFPLDVETEKKSLEVLLPLMEDKSGNFLSQEEETFSNYKKWLEDNSFLTGKVESKDIFEEIIK